ncbi:MAG: bifunctional phosphoribosylaminoimidazolecarboxamide formyltransferase/IMP cyclohydrolase [Bradymonadaceae bacterium]
MSNDDPCALISVSDKQGVAQFAEALAEAGYRILSTGGTAARLRDHGVEVEAVSEVTGFPEIFDGRVKTLHPLIHGGVLAREDRDDDRATRREHDIPRIDLVCVNLYPFEETVAGGDSEFEQAVEQIDIGGPTLLRAAAKNFAHKTVVVDNGDHDRVLEAIEAGGPDRQLRRQLALRAFRHTARYDASIAHYFEAEVEPVGHRQLPESWSIGLDRTTSLRYGENPHQQGALYHEATSRPWGGFEKLHGKDLSYNNLVDLDAALQLTLEFDQPAVSIIKHTNPAGCAVGDTVDEAYERALACDPMSAYGGIVVANRPIGAELGERMNEKFFEVVAAPEYTEGGLEELTDRESVRILRMPNEIAEVPRMIRATTLGFVTQTSDPPVEFARDDLEVPTDRAPTDAEWRGLAFNWRVCKHVKSNAIVLGGENRTLGVGAGQMSRVDAVNFAVQKSRQDLAGAVLVSDAFFPFRDGVDAAHEAGIRAVVQPGGSKNDPEVVEACDEHDIAMVMTGERHFRH